MSLSPSEVLVHSPSKPLIHAPSILLVHPPSKLRIHSPSKLLIHSFPPQPQAQDLANVSDIEVLEWQNSDPTRAHLNTEKVEASLWRKADTRAFLDNRWE